MINMKNLFNNKASASSDESSAAVRDIIREMVEKENKNSPLTDDEIRNNLVNKKILIARRTIAKYRNILRIPSSNKRRKQ
jgi:RNA polymerase sigma-54 factor